jgi:hypothetical protein
LFANILPNIEIFDQKVNLIFYIELIGDNFNIENLGEVIYIYYPHLFILASLSLFVAIIGPIALSYISFDHDKFFISKKQDIFKQTLRHSVDLYYVD